MEDFTEGYQIRLPAPAKPFGVSGGNFFWGGDIFISFLDMFWIRDLMNV